uniref:40S ribosomal protein S3a n=1 Tax=Balaenoptera musculus TaxID=9771 RepID=A0A8C0DEJ6_BALMU
LAVSNNKRLTKGSKKGAKKKVVDQFPKKDWYDVKVPAMFNIRNIGKTLVTRTQGTKITSDGLKGRVFEVIPADLQNDEAAFRKFKLITEDVQGSPSLNWENTRSYVVKVVVLEKLPGTRQVLKLNQLMDMSHQSKNLFKIQTFNGDK